MSKPTKNLTDFLKHIWNELEQRTTEKRELAKQLQTENEELHKKKLELINNLYDSVPSASSVIIVKDMLERQDDISKVLSEVKLNSVKSSQSNSSDRNYNNAYWKAKIKENHNFIESPYHDVSAMIFDKETEMERNLLKIKKLKEELQLRGEKQDDGVEISRLIAILKCIESKQNVLLTMLRSNEVK